MTKTVIVLCASLFIAPISTSAQMRSGAQRATEAAANLLESGLREAARVRPTSAAAQQQTQRTWAGRHPVLLGALIGAGAGVGTGASYCAQGTGGDVTCGQYLYLFGLLGAGAGTAVGLAIAAAQR